MEGPRMDWIISFASIASGPDWAGVANVAFMLSRRRLLRPLGGITPDGLT